MSCDAGKKVAPLPRERSEIVLAPSGPHAALAPSSPPASVTAAPVPSGPRHLCEGQDARAPRDLPKAALSRKAALGAKTLAPALSTGQWTLVNLWAAWCGPCKEELPRLSKMAVRLARTGRPLSLVFVSLDDDERQLEQFLAAQPETGLRATYWLREGQERDTWLSRAGVAKDPALPVQLVIDPRGKIACIVKGAVQDQDFPEIAALVGAPK
ncbi:MAG TPA: TlpA disulfide reductase family protein [Polyangiaceae bacterium]|nr:TlpA disulfide reductase family protein [Polyangiaceae bacterium]